MIEEYRGWMESSNVIPVFPSPVWKIQLDANPNVAERISVSFNVMLSSLTEKLSQPLWGGEESS